MDKSKPKRKVKVKTLNINVNEPICDCPEQRYGWGFGETRIYIKCAKCGAKSYTKTLQAIINPTFPKTETAKKAKAEAIREELMGDWWGGKKNESGVEQIEAKETTTLKRSLDAFMDTDEKYCRCSHPAFGDGDGCLSCNKTLLVMKDVKKT